MLNHYTKPGYKDHFSWSPISGYWWFLLVH